MSEILDQDWQRIIASQIEHSAICAAENIRVIFSEHANPSVLYRPALSVDGNQWCALYGVNLQEGVAGFGETPALAMRDFDIQWLNAKATQAAPTDAPGEPDDLLTVAHVTTDGGGILTMLAASLGDLIDIVGDEPETYSISIATMKRAEFEALGEFDGF